MNKLWILVGLLIFVSLFSEVTLIVMRGCHDVWCYSLRPLLTDVSIAGVFLGTILALSLFTWGWITRRTGTKSIGENQESITENNENPSYVKRRPFWSALLGLFLSAILLLVLLIGWPLLLTIIYSNPAASISDSAIVKITFHTDVGTKTVQLPRDEAKAVISLLKGRPDEVSRYNPWRAGGILVFPDGNITIENINYEFESYMGWVVRREDSLLWNWAFWREKNNELEYIQRLRKEMENMAVEPSP